MYSYTLWYMHLMIFQVYVLSTLIIIKNVFIHFVVFQVVVLWSSIIIKNVFIHFVVFQVVVCFVSAALFKDAIKRWKSDRYRILMQPMAAYVFKRQVFLLLAQSELKFDCEVSAINR